MENNTVPRIFRCLRRILNIHYPELIQRESGPEHTFRRPNTAQSSPTRKRRSVAIEEAAATRTFWWELKAIAIDRKRRSYFC